ncbi:MAG: lipid A deacylase LpxR family protein [Sneathiellaceae bacterium]
MTAGRAGRPTLAASALAALLAWAMPAAAADATQADRTPADRIQADATGQDAPGPDALPLNSERPVAAAPDAPKPVAKESYRDHDKGTLAFIWENDIFAGTDQNYTNGLRLSYVSPPVDGAQDWHRAIAGALLGAGSDEEVRYGIAAGQSIYTPSDIEASQPLPDQHPYAGWLYGEYSLFAQGADHLRMAALQIGMVGPTAGAETVQNNVHARIGSPKAEGWDNQLHDELAFAVLFEQRERAWLSRRLLGPELDLTPHWGASLGTLRTQAVAGLTVRFGEDLRNDYGPPRVRPALGGSGFFEAVDGFRWYLFAGVEGRAVAHNIFLDGNTFQDSASVTRKPLVADFQGGLVLTYGATQMAYTFVTRSREFDTQTEPQMFGSVSLSVKF